MAKMDVVNFLISDISRKIFNDPGEEERALIIAGLVDNWDDKKYLRSYFKDEPLTVHNWLYKTDWKKMSKN